MHDTPAKGECTCSTLGERGAVSPLPSLAEKNIQSGGVIAREREERGCQKVEEKFFRNSSSIFSALRFFRRKDDTWGEGRRRKRGPAPSHTFQTTHVSGEVMWTGFHNFRSQVFVPLAENLLRFMSGDCVLLLLRGRLPGGGEQDEGGGSGGSSVLL